MQAANDFNPQPGGTNAITRECNFGRNAEPHCDALREEGENGFEENPKASTTVEMFAINNYHCRQNRVSLVLDVPPKSSY